MVARTSNDFDLNLSNVAAEDLPTTSKYFVSSPVVVVYRRTLDSCSVATPLLELALTKLIESCSS